MQIDEPRIRPCKEQAAWPVEMHACGHGSRKRAMPGCHERRAPLVARLRVSEDFVRLAIQKAQPHRAAADDAFEMADATAAAVLLARIQRVSAADPAVSTRFADQTVLIQGRIDPYHLTTARVHPDVAPTIQAEVERTLSTRETLVLGDYSPKNTFIYPDRVVIIDFEVAHWGDPAFDVAFCLTHLVLKACRFRDRATEYLDAASTFCDAFGTAPAGTVAELGCLLLARIDGKSKIEYITDEAMKTRVRRLAKEILAGRDDSVRRVLDHVAETCGASR